MRKKKMGPFTPQFGRRPASFIGRQDIINELLDGIYDLNSPMRTTIISGVRGAGKTALLSDICEELAEDKGWMVINVSASDEILSEIYDQLIYHSRELLPLNDFKLAGIEIGPPLAKINVQKTIIEPASFYTKMMQVLDLLENKNISIFIAIDEIKNIAPIKTLAITYQLLIRQEYEICLMMAGLPQYVISIQNDKDLTFLKRSHHVFLKNIDLLSLRLEYERIFGLEGKSFTPAALDLAYLSTGGYPYMYQLIGYYLWKDSSSIISEDEIKKAVNLSVADLSKNVLSMAFNDLTETEQNFLIAMASDDETSKVEDIHKRMGKSRNYISQYRRTLIDLGMIEPVGHGLIRFTIPYMNVFLKEKIKEKSFVFAETNYNDKP